LHKGHTIESTVEDYYVDVVSRKHGLTFFNEAEVKVGWSGQWNPTWLDVRIPERKTRLLNEYREKDGVLNFYVFDKDLKQAWRIKDTYLTQDVLREASGRNIRKGEQFYHIPVEQAELIKVPE